MTAKHLQFEDSIRDGYHINWYAFPHRLYAKQQRRLTDLTHRIIDNLPSAAAIDDMETRTQTTVYDIGFPLGKVHVRSSWHMPPFEAIALILTAVSAVCLLVCVADS